MAETIRTASGIDADRASLLLQATVSLKEGLRVLDILDLDVAAMHIQWALDIVGDQER